jgi:hypothetical protein
VRRLLAAALPGAAIGAWLLAQTAPSRAPSADGPIALVGDVATPRVHDEVLAVARRAWQLASELYGDGGRMPEHPCTLRLDPSVEQYTRACDFFGVPNLKSNLAFTEYTTTSAHIVLQPALAGEAREKLAPTWQTLRLVAHETAHLARASIVPNLLAGPDWFLDGNASWVEMKTLQALGRLAAPEAAPYFAEGEVRVQKLLRSGKLPALDDVVHDRVDQLALESRYAVRLLLFRFLIEGRHAKAFRAFLADLRREGGGEGLTERAAEDLKRELGAPVWSRLDDEFHAWVAALKPEWEETIRTLETEGDVWTQSAFDRHDAVAFRTDPCGAKPYRISGSVTLLPDREAAPQANVLLGRVALSAGVDRFVSVAFKPDSAVTLFDFDGGRPELDQWRRLAAANERASRVGAPIPFRITCTPKGGATEVAVDVDERRLFSATVDRPLEGPYGVGVQAGNSCIWRGVKRTPAPPR